VPACGDQWVMLNAGACKEAAGVALVVVPEEGRPEEHIDSQAFPEELSSAVEEVHDAWRVPPEFLGKTQGVEVHDAETDLDHSSEILH